MRLWNDLIAFWLQNEWIWKQKRKEFQTNLQRWFQWMKMEWQQKTMRTVGDKLLQYGWSTIRQNEHFHL